VPGNRRPLPLRIERPVDPIWTAIARRSLTVLDWRRLPRSVRGPYEASREIPAPLANILMCTVYWCGDRSILLMGTPEITLDLDVVASWFGMPIHPAEPTEVSVLAGSDLTAVPPAGLAAMMTTFIDESLLSLSYLWVPLAEPGLWAALTPSDLVRVSGAYPVSIQARPMPRRQRGTIIPLAR
jgi:prolyl-tRNA editing enzyme YbaK/EbsC (Cys-tRNA(Pro) deacylase)